MKWRRATTLSPLPVLAMGMPVRFRARRWIVVSILTALTAFTLWSLRMSSGVDLLLIAVGVEYMLFYVYQLLSEVATEARRIIARGTTPDPDPPENW